MTGRLWVQISALLKISALGPLSKVVKFSVAFSCVQIGFCLKKKRNKNLPNHLEPMNNGKGQRDRVSIKAGIRLGSRGTAGAGKVLKYTDDHSFREGLRFLDFVLWVFVFFHVVKYTSCSY